MSHRWLIAQDHRGRFLVVVIVSETETTTLCSAPLHDTLQKIRRGYHRHDHGTMLRLSKYRRGAVNWRPGSGTKPIRLTNFLTRPRGAVESLSLPFLRPSLRPGSHGSIPATATADSLISAETRNSKPPSTAPSLTGPRYGVFIADSLPMGWRGKVNFLPFLFPDTLMVLNPGDDCLWRVGCCLPLHTNIDESNKHVRSSGGRS